jgi:hypothetical protein
VVQIVVVGVAVLVVQVVLVLVVTVLDLNKSVILFYFILFCFILWSDLIFCLLLLCKIGLIFVRFAMLTVSLWPNFVVQFNSLYCSLQIIQWLHCIHFEPFVWMFTRRKCEIFDLSFFPEVFRRLLAENLSLTNDRVLSLINRNFPASFHSSS